MSQVVPERDTTVVPVEPAGSRRRGSIAMVATLAKRTLGFGVAEPAPPDWMLNEAGGGKKRKAATEEEREQECVFRTELCWFHLRDQAPWNYIDPSLPLGSATFNHLAWQCVFSKRAVWKVGTVACTAFAIYFVRAIISRTADHVCPGFDGAKHPERVHKDWMIWMLCVPFVIFFCMMVRAFVYHGFMLGHHGAMLKHAFRIPYSVLSAWLILGGIVALAINPQTDEQKEMTCMVDVDKDSGTMTYMGGVFPALMFVIGAFCVGILLASFCGKCGFWSVLVFWVLCACVTFSAVQGSPPDSAEKIACYLVLAFFCFIMAYLHLSRHFLIRSTEKGIKADKHSYDLALEEHVQAADMASHPAIIRLANLADCITKEEGPANADLHMHRQQQHQQGGAKARNATILQVDSQGRPTSDRFALFERAWTVNPAFQEHAATVWAAAHGGIHHFALVKGVHRVYQKVNRAYRGRMARVLDIVRTTITFATLDQLVSCLETIKADPKIKILRIKNRYSPFFDSLDGYRDVSMLVVGSSLTQGFVCELQLNLESMFQAKTLGGGHKRYILARDAKGD